MCILSETMLEISLEYANKDKEALREEISELKRRLEIAYRVKAVMNDIANEARRQLITERAARRVREGGKVDG